MDPEAPGLSLSPSPLTSLFQGSQAARKEWGLSRLVPPQFLNLSGLSGYQESGMGTHSLLEISQLSQQAWLHLAALP